ncbi:MAG: hypothetical protein ACKO96_26940, partial [Flammeovirgaceae bacterium]
PFSPACIYQMKNPPDGIAALEKMEVDGRFAQVWCDYAFYVGNKFSHCGVDAFHLFKGSDNVWRIFHLVDTRRREGCAVPESVSSQFK